MFFDKYPMLYKPPKIPNGFPIELGTDLYNLDTSNRKAVEEVMKKYDLHGEPPHTLITNEFINILEKKIKPMIKGAIVGAMPTEEDLDILESHLLKIESPKYVCTQLNSLIYSNLSEDEVGRFIIEEDVDFDEKPLWKIYEWIFLVWNLAIPVRHCAAEYCDKIFIPSTDRKKEVYHDQKCYWRESKRRYRKKLKEK